MLIPKKTKYILGTLIISFLSIFAGKGEARIFDSSVQSIQYKPCASDGYSTWDGWFWHNDGKDCWCNDRSNVVDPCSS